MGEAFGTMKLIESDRKGTTMIVREVERKTMIGKGLGSEGGSKGKDKRNATVGEDLR